MVMVTTVPLVCNKIMFTQALNVRAWVPLVELSPAEFLAVCVIALGLPAQLCLIVLSGRLPGLAFI
jgi:hypothetical protein